MPYSPDPAQILLHNPQDYDYIVDSQSFPSQPAAAQAHMIQFREQARDESVQLPESFERGARVKGRMDNYWRNRVVRDFKPTVDIDKKAELEMRKEKIHHKPRQIVKRVAIKELMNLNRSL